MNNTLPIVPKKPMSTDSSVNTTCAASLSYRRHSSIHIPCPSQGVSIFFMEIDPTVNIGDNCYKIYGGKFLTMTEAETIYNKLLEECGTQYEFLLMHREKKSSWNDIEIQLLQWVVLNLSNQSNKSIADFVLRLLK